MNPAPNKLARLAAKLFLLVALFVLPQSAQANGCSSCADIPCDYELVTTTETVEIGRERSCYTNDDGEEVCSTIVYTEEVDVVERIEDCSNQDACYDECMEEEDDEDANGYGYLVLPKGKVPACLMPLIEIEPA